MRILSGIQPSGKLHLGNDFGMMKPALELQEKGETYLFIANYHALTTIESADELREYTMDVALDLLACGLDPDKARLFRQSDVPEVTELTWLLSVVTPMGLLQRCHSYKDKLAKGIAPNHALFAYPVLMAADILAYQSNVVPVGRDQKQHVEVARDIAIKFNNTYGETFTIPEPDIRDDVAVVPGVDGQKMSKSYNNHVELFSGEKVARKKIMGIVTDCKTLEEPKDPNDSVILAIYKLMASEADYVEMSEKYAKGGYGYGDAKKALFEAVWTYFAPYREKREELKGNLDYVESVLKKGAEKAQVEAQKTLDRARKAMGLT